MFGENRSQITETLAFAGTTIRYLYMLVGIAVFAITASVMWRGASFLSYLTPSAATPVEITVPDLARLKPVSKAWQNGMGTLQEVSYGRVYDRDTDFKLVVVMPSQSMQASAWNFMSELRDMREIYNARYAYPQTFYDMETRFGPIRSTHFQMEVDGRAKLCMAYVSRFETGSLTYKGWFCEANGARPNPNALACMLDRLVIKGKLPSADAQAFLDTKIRKPGHCTADPVSQTVDTRTVVRPRRLMP